MKKIDKQTLKIISQYKKELKDYIIEHELDLELYQDLNERIEEKLSNIEKPTKTDALTIIAEIGSPEEIFASEINSPNDEIKNFKWKFLNKFRRNGNKNKVIFLGVFKELGDKIEINANYLRLAYLLLILLSFVVVVNMTPILIFLYFLGFIFLRTGIIRFIFSGIVGLACFFLLIPAISLLGAYISDFHINNIYIFKGFTFMLPVGLAIGIFSLLFLIYVFFAYAFTKKFFWKIFLTAMVTTLVAITMGVAVVFQIVQKFTFQSTGDYRIETVVEGQKTLSLDSQFSNVKNNFILNREFSTISSYGRNITLTRSTDNKIHFYFNQRVYGAGNLQEYAQKYLENLQITISKDGKINFETNKNDNVKYPLFFIELELEEIALPTGVVLEIYDNFVFSISQNNNIIYPEELENYKDYINEACSKLVFTQDDELICQMNGQEILQFIQSAKYRYLYENLEEIVPLKFSSSAYTWDGPFNTNWIDEDTITFQIGDGRTYLDVQAQVVNQDGKFTVKDFRFLNIEGDLNKNWYLNPEIIVQTK